MKINLLKAIEELKEQLTSGWSPSEREQFDKFLEEEIKPYWSNLYSLLHGDFEAELRKLLETLPIWYRKLLKKELLKENG